MSLDNPYLLWAKLPPRESGSPAFHPLICHMLDVAAVTRLMWRELLSGAARRQIADALGLSVMEAERWITYLAAMHDLGKASPIFQLRKEASHLYRLYEELGQPASMEAKECPHGRVTAHELPDILRAVFDLDNATSDRLSVVVGGHHGTFPTSHELENQCPSKAVGGRKWRDLRGRLATLTMDLLEMTKDAIPRQCDHSSAMFIAGLVSVADWIGSNSDYFPYLVDDFDSLPDLPLSDYYTRAEKCGSEALEKLGWMGWHQPSAKLTFSDLFKSISDPRPLQQATIELANEIVPPGIAIIEAPMGEGKTEAALYLADHWGVAPGPRGCYVALPTQATSNQMFTRVREFLSIRYPAEIVNLQLLHGHAALSSEFRLLRANGDKAFKIESICGEEGCGSGDASIIAAEWFTHRKRGLLAPFGVGTIDQALLAVLQTRHVFVRLFGLSHKVVIVDEVHAYDAYMSKLLERLLEWLAALGSPVVLLSATLPNDKRTALLNAYLRGLKRKLNPEEETSLNAGYPRISWATGKRQGARTIEVSDRIRRTLRIEWVDESMHLGQRLKEALSGGGCAAVICNTVNRAQETYLSLKPYFDNHELDLFHARYLFKDRNEREKRALADFGKEGSIIKFDDDDERPVKRPFRKVLVATQVIEQSLDLDFDLMVTDCAPVDLVLQRSGRLHRHHRRRPEKLDHPVLWIRQPESVEDEAPKFDSGSSAVYDAHVLLRSWLALQNRNEIRVPDDIESLVEFAYTDMPCPAELAASIQEQWRTTVNKLQESLKKMESEALKVIVPQPTYPDNILDANNRRLEEDEPEIHQSLQALTRLTEPNVAVICLTPEQRLRFNLNKEPTVKIAKDLLHYSICLSSKRIIWTVLAQKAPATWKKSALLRRHRLLELNEAGICSIGKYRLQVHPELGVTIKEAGEDT